MSESHPQLAHRGWYSRPILVGAICAGLVALLGTVLSVNYYRAVAAFTEPSVLSFELRREAIWWAAATFGAFLYASLGVYLLGVRLGRFWPVVRILLLMLGALIGPIAVWYAIEFTKPREGFECILPSPFLVWSSTVVAAVFILFAARRRAAAA